MNTALPSHRIHPLVAVAAAAVTVFSLVGIAAITGLLPLSHGSNNPASQAAVQAPVAPLQAADASWDDPRSAGKNPQANQPAVHAKAGAVEGSGRPVAVAQGAPATPAPQAAHKTPQNSAVGIGVGAVVGGVLGNQIGQGDGKTLATILGAVGGGYVGNEIAKRNQQ